MKSGKKINKGLLITLLALLAMLVIACEGGSGPTNVTQASIPIKTQTSQQILNLPLSVPDIQHWIRGRYRINLLPRSSPLSYWLSAIERSTPGDTTVGYHLDLLF